MANGPVLVVGGRGKTGSRVVQRLEDRGIPVRLGSRIADRPFDWEDPTTWAQALDGVDAAYVTYYPADAIPGAAATIGSFAGLAVEQGVRRLVYLSGRGEEEAQRAEAAVRESGADWTILRCSWFNQNFSEGFLHDAILAGEVTLPPLDAPEPFLDADDIADAAVVALTEPGHIGKLYE